MIDAGGDLNKESYSAKPLFAALFDADMRTDCHAERLALMLAHPSLDLVTLVHDKPAEEYTRRLDLKEAIVAEVRRGAEESFLTRCHPL